VGGEGHYDTKDQEKYPLPCANYQNTVHVSTINDGGSKHLLVLNSISFILFKTMMKD